MLLHKAKQLFVSVLLYLIGLLHTTFLSAQSEFSYSPFLSFRVESAFLKSAKYHSVIKPFYLSIDENKALIDSVYAVITSEHNDMLTLNSKKFKIITNPIIQSSFRISNIAEQHYALGLRIQSEWDKKLIININYSVHGLTRNGFANTRTDSAGIAYSLGKVQKQNANYYLLLNFTGNITYNPNRFLSFQLGKDRHFWGDGYRSLYISDNSPSFPYFSTSVNIWKFKYTNMVAVMNDYAVGKYSMPFQKYSAMHILSWNASNRLNFNVFEAVVWARKDSSNSRALDINYLNPFIFYRPVEYTLGSPDNVLIGTGMHYRALKSTYIYGQLMLDEFLMKEIAKNRGWWANKHALQFGMKIFDLFNFSDLYLQLEYNHARPFTYSHSRPSINYGYLLQPLAHPAGANFREGLGIIRYAKGWWTASSYVSYLKYGAEPSGKTVGSDIYISNNERIKYNNADFGHFIGQGILAQQFTQQFTISRMLQPSWGLAAECSFRNVSTYSTTKSQQVYIMFGLKTQLYRDEKLF